MKKISTILALVMVMALALPVMAADHEDNVKVTGEVNTNYEVVNYGEDADKDTTDDFFEDGDAYDDDIWAENGFYQELDFSVEAMVNDGTNLSLDLGTVTNEFTGDTDDTNELTKDVALLTLENDAYTVKLGDLEDYAVETYFLDEKSLDGMEMTTAVAGNDVKVFALGENSNDLEVGDDTPSDPLIHNEDSNYYGVTVSRDLDVATVTGKLYQATDYGSLFTDPDNDDEVDTVTTEGDLKVTNFALCAKADVTEMVSVNGEVVSNSYESDELDMDDGDTLIKVGTEVTPMDALTVTADMKQVGEKFAGVEDDLSGLDYTMYEVGGDYELTDAMSVGGTLTLDTYDAKNEDDETTIELRGSNEMGALTTDVTFTNESEDDDNVEPINTLAVNNTYALNEATELKGNFTYKSQKDAENYTYLLVGANYEMAENVTLDTEAFMVTGEDEAADKDGKGNGFKVNLTTKF